MGALRLNPLARLALYCVLVTGTAMAQSGPNGSGVSSVWESTLRNTYNGWTSNVSKTPNLAYLWLANPSSAPRAEFSALSANQLQLNFGKFAFGAGVGVPTPLGSLESLRGMGAWHADFGIEKDRWGARLGYSQIESLYGINPTLGMPSVAASDVQGPSASLHYNVNDSLRLSASGEWFSGAGKGFDSLSSSFGNGFSPDDRLTRWSAELAYKARPDLNLSLGLQSLDYSLKGRPGIGLDGLRTSQRWYTIGLGYNFTGNASLNFSWKISDYAVGTPLFGNSSPSSARPSSNLISTQLTIKF